jgi:hypothetical protein
LRLTLLKFFGPAIVVGGKKLDGWRSLPSISHHRHERII